MLAADEAAWKGAGPITWGAERYRTTFRALWADQALYVRFDSVDPDPWHTMTTRDAHLWEEEVIEIFLDPALAPLPVSTSPQKPRSDTAMVNCRGFGGMNVVLVVRAEAASGE